MARKLLGAGAFFFLPVYEREWRSRGQTLRSFLPLFPGYIFLLGDYQTVLEARASKLVANSLTVPDHEQLHADLCRIHRLIASGVPMTPESRLVPGTWVEVTRGPLTGLTGKIVRRGKRARILVEVQLIRQGVLADVDEWTVKPLSRASSEIAAMCGAD
jgi:transcriptional antiterminator NusG